ncbi:MAG: hypothetical protein EOP48_28900 [Sphingobacteriales bacterium]|nr:MAG: hypothetical protein EOP48_28900 [Sphingobacteriales bacterium]
MNWKELRDKIYYQDGSLRDIYIKDTTQEDWRKWVDYVTANYPVAFTTHDGDVTSDKIDFSKVVDLWNGSLDSSISATIHVGGILVKAYFFSDEEIENDITPKEVNTLDDHNGLVEYLMGLSKALKKNVVLTPENEPETTLISVYEGNVFLLPTN